MPAALASSIWAALARTQTYIGRKRYSDFVVGLVRETDGTVESFVGVVVAETDLQFYGLDKLPLFAGGEEFRDSLLQEVRVDLTHELNIMIISFI